jgi:hypothetical protein
VAHGCAVLVELGGGHARHLRRPLQVHARRVERHDGLPPGPVLLLLRRLAAAATTAGSLGSHGLRAEARKCVEACEEDKTEEKKTMVGESDRSRGSGLNNPGAARCRAVPLRAVNARNNRAPRRNPRCDASLPTSWPFPLLTGKWACAATVASGHAPAARVP